MNQGTTETDVSYIRYGANHIGYGVVSVKGEPDLDLVLKSSEQMAILSYHNNQLANQILLNICISLICADCLFIPQLDEQNVCSDDKFVPIESASNDNDLITINNINITEFDNLL